MKYARFFSQGKIGYGTVENGKIKVLTGNFFEGATAPTGEVLNPESVQMLAPVFPVSVLCIGKNYKDHAMESGGELPKNPLLFIKAVNSVCGHGTPVRIGNTSEPDYEAELAVVIGKDAYQVSEADAPDYVFGYTCANDVSARDCQFSDGQWCRGKSFDTFCPLGPWIETELDVSDLRITGRLNGEVMQDDRTSRLIFPVPALISYLSRTMTLLRGTVILTGTPAGCGFAKNPPLRLKKGDVYQVEIEGIGTLSNPME